MRVAVDLHSHSGYAGGVGQITLEAVSRTMKWKGIDVFGSGDCLFPPRTQELKSKLEETAEGLFSISNDKSKFLLQTEVIFSTKLAHKKNKIIAHHIILFPDFTAIEKMQILMKKWQMKNTIGRPFIISNAKTELIDQLYQIAAIDPYLEIIPAHIMTPDGIFGSKNDLDELIEFYGAFLSNINAIETGLSADPKMLEKIPDLAELTFISNSDCHSAALNRIGREFSVLNVKELSYHSIINAIRENHVQLTAEFNPAEGRYFLTGHRADRKGHQDNIVFSKNIPENLLCPKCGKKMNLGVQQRCLNLQDKNIRPIKRDFIHLIPLTEVLAHSYGIKNPNAKKVKTVYEKLIGYFSSEIALWRTKNLREKLATLLPEKVVQEITAVQQGNFQFDPPGFDGIYGKLKIGS